MKKYLILFSSLGFSFLYAKQASAVCPICSVAVGAGVGLTRSLGVDDAIVGLWIGGLTVSMIFWTISWFEKKKINFYARSFITSIVYYLMIVLPLYFLGIMSNPLNGVDKLFVGIFLGSFGFYLGANYYETLKQKNNNHSYFPFQKVVMPLSPIVLLSIVFYFITK